MSCQQWPFGSHVHKLDYFVMSCPVLRSFTLLSFGNKFSSKITKLACKQALLLKMAHGRNIGAWLLVFFEASNQAPIFRPRAISTEEPACSL